MTYFTAEFDQTFKEKLIPTPSQTIPKKTEEKVILLNSLYKASITLIPKPQQIKKTKPLSLKNTDAKTSPKY